MEGRVAELSLRDITEGLDQKQARWLVDLYYTIQDYRIQATGQERAVEQETDEGSVNVISWLAAHTDWMETEIRKALDKFSSEHTAGVWAKSITGIGPVIAAGLLAHIDIQEAPTAGSIWRFAGLDPTSVWLGKEKAAAIVKAVHTGSKPVTDSELVEIAKQANLKPERILARLASHPTGPKKPTAANITSAVALRPWNASLKVLCWKIGDSFVKQSGRESDVYGKVYRERKLLEVSRNDSGLFAEQAAEKLRTRNITDSDLLAKLRDGKLPDGQLDLRARRYATKLFLSHFHWVLFESTYGKPPPDPYVIAHLGHAHLLRPSNWEDGQVVIPRKDKKGKGKKK